MQIPEIEIIVTQGGTELLRRTVRPGDYVIGREPECEVQLEVERVSGRHAQLTVNFDHALIEDLGSDSGTFVNGQRVSDSTRLWPNQKIQIGAASVELHRIKTVAPPDATLAPSTAAVQRLLPEEILREKKYDIGGVVARGGMGAILDAREASIERTVAMKVMLDNSSPDDLTRFVAEAKVTGQLEHPNIVPVHELGVDENDQIYYTMKFVQGITLRQVLEQLAEGDAGTIRKYPLSALLTVFQKVCDAVAFAHSKGVIHRDLKPDNIMLGDYGEVLVMDWGLAKTLGGTRSCASPTSAAEDDQGRAGARPSAASHTQQGAIMGTPRYMAPEQARGEIDALDARSDIYALDARSDIYALDARSDIYALGAILYHLLTLQSPIEGATLDEILAKVRAGQFVPPIQRVSRAKPRPSAPAPKPKSNRPLPQVDLDAQTVLHTEGAEAEAVAAVYDRRNADREADASNSTPANSAPGGHRPPLQHTSGGHRPPLQHLPGGSVPESLNAVVLKAMALEQAARYQSIAELQADLTAYQTGFATRAENASLGKQLVLLIKRHKGIFTTAAAAWLIITALAGWFVINVTRARDQAETERNVAARERDRATANEQKAVERGEETRHALAKSQIALAEAAYREHDGAAMQMALAGVPDDLREANWSYLLAHADNSVATLRTRANGSIVDAAPHPKRPGVFAIIASDGAVAMVEAATGVRLLEFRTDFKIRAGFEYHVAISPDGEKLAIGKGDEGGIVIHSTRDGKKLTEWNSEASGRLQFNADGNALLQVSRSTNALNLLDAATGRTLWSVKSDSGNGNLKTVAIFAPDGQTVLAAFGKGGLTLVSAKDGSIVRSYPVVASTEQVATSPDGARIYNMSGGGIVSCVQNKDDGRVLYQFRADGNSGKDLACTADGSRLVTLGNFPDGKQLIKIWDAQTGAPIETLMGGGGQGYRIRVHPLSREIVVAGQTSKVWLLPAVEERWKFGESRYVTGAFWGGDDLLLTGDGKSKGVRLLDLGLANPVKQPLWEFAGNTQYSMAVSADQRFAGIVPRLATTTGEEPVRLFRLNGRAVEEAGSIDPQGTFRQLLLSPDGALLVVFNTGGSTGKVIDLASGKALATLDQSVFRSLYALSWVGNTRLVTAVTVGAPRGLNGAKEQLILWDAATGKQMKTVDSSTAILSLAALPGATFFAEAGADRMVRLRDATTLEVKREFRAHDEAITALALHPTRPILATASDDLTVKLWDLESGRCLEELRGPTGATARLEISPSGKRLACWADTMTRIWEPKCFSEKPEDKVDADGWENVLAELKPEVVAKTGHGWQWTSGALLSPNLGNSSIALPGNFAQSSYQVRVKLRQLAPQNGFAVVLPVADRQVAFNLDGFPEEGHFTSLAQIDGQSSQTVPGALHGKQIHDSDQHELQVSVRLEGANVGVEATLDDAPLYQWSGPVTSLSLNSVWPAVPPGSLAIGTSGADWVVYGVKVKRLEGK